VTNASASSILIFNYICSFGVTLRLHIPVIQTVQPAEVKNPGGKLESLLGQNRTCLIVLFLLMSDVLNNLHINSYMVYLKNPFSVLYFSFFILLRSAESCLIHPQVIYSMLMILNSIYHSRLLTPHTISLILNKPYLSTECL
jgi:hypothetical protein